MVVDIIHPFGVPFLKRESDPPISGYLHGPLPLPIPFERVEARSWEIHIFDSLRRLEPVEYIRQLPGLFGLDAFLRPVVEKVLQPFMPEAFDH